MNDLHDINSLAVQIEQMVMEISELKSLIKQFVAPATTLSIAEKARIMREAHASGDRKKIMAATKLINQ